MAIGGSVAQAITCMLHAHRERRATSARLLFLCLSTVGMARSVTKVPASAHVRAWHTRRYPTIL